MNTNFEFMLYNNKVRWDVAKLKRISGDKGCSYFRTKKEKCPICLKSMENDGGIALKCNHSFHSLCIEHWWTRNRNCPLCRMDHSEEEKEDEEEEEIDSYSEQL